MSDYSSSIDINASGSGSRLLFLESPIISSKSSYYQTSSGEEDLSLSELSLSDDAAIMQKPFSLLARVEPEPEPITPMRSEKIQNSETSDQVRYSDFKDDALNDDDLRQSQEQAAKQKEEKLKSDIFILKKLNASFELFNDALNETGSANQVCLLFYALIISLFSTCSELQPSCNKPMLF